MFFFRAKDILTQTLPFIEQHVHTNYTDGTASIGTMVQSAISMGCQQIVFTEHVQRSSSWFFRFREEVFLLQKKYKDKIKIGIGVEAKLIDLEGNIDCRNGYFEGLDLIIGSVHGYPYKKNKFVEFENLTDEEGIQREFECALLLVHSKNNINVLGHPMGVAIKNYNKRVSKHYFDFLAKILADNQIAFEINSKYHKNYFETILKYCKKYDTLISVGTDAHNPFAIGAAWKTLIN